jgi:hypothetical protein
MRERSLRRFMLITPEKVCVERLYCAVRSHKEPDLCRGQKEFVICCSAILELAIFMI